MLTEIPRIMFIAKQQQGNKSYSFSRTTRFHSASYTAKGFIFRVQSRSFFAELLGPMTANKGVLKQGDRRRTEIAKKAREPFPRYSDSLRSRTRFGTIALRPQVRSPLQAKPDTRETAVTVENDEAEFGEWSLGAGHSRNQCTVRKWIRLERRKRRCWFHCCEAMANKKRTDDIWKQIRAIATRIHVTRLFLLPFFVLDEETEKILVNLKSREEYKTINASDVPRMEMKDRALIEEEEIQSSGELTIENA